MSLKEDDLFKSFKTYGPKINSLYFRLKGYKFFHKSSGVHTQDPRIIGRQKIKKELLSLLKNDESKSGTYLITGSRGMGKTSLVNDVLSQWINKTAFRWKDVFLYFAIAMLIGIGLTFLLGYLQLFIGIAHLAIVVLLLLSYNFIYELFQIYKENPEDKPMYFFKDSSISKRQNFFISLVIGLILGFTSQILNFGIVALLTTIFFLGLALMYYYFYREKTIKRRRSKNLLRWLQKDILLVNLDIGQEDITDSIVLKQIVSKLSQKCLEIKAGAQIRRKVLTWTVSILLTSLIMLLVGQEGRIKQVSASKFWQDYFPSQRLVATKVKLDSNVNMFRVEEILHYTDSLKEISLDSVNALSVSINTDTISKPAVPTENIGWLLQNLNRIVKASTGIVDQAIFNLYLFATPVLFSKEYWYSNDLQHTMAIFIHRLNYARILTFIVFSFAITTLLNFILRGYKPYFIRALKQIDDLKGRIYAQTSEVDTAGLVQNRFFNWSRRKTRTYPLAGKYEIQMEVQRIIEVINHGHSWFPFLPINRQILFVIDELDKLDTDLYFEDHDGESQQEGSSHEELHKINPRQEMVIKMFQSLKSFFNNTRAKFIFIAGDDMYDAAIADASNNRQHSIDRLFHRIFYVPSFYSDNSDRRKSSISSMTEAYICQFLIPHVKSGIAHSENYYDKESEILEHLNLAAYYKHFFENEKSRLRIYMEKEGVKSKTGIRVEEIQESQISNLIRIKSLYTLQNFVTYLAYQSNGSPKKITSLFEEQVTQLDSSKREFGTVIISDSPNDELGSEGFYLRFTEEDQYKFGLINYLVVPFLNTQKRYLKSFGDKLLVSTSFIIDHLYKYHDNAFSWKTLELTPEIISVSRAPQLRGFIKEVMHHFSRTHIDRITSGLYDFKFIGKVKNEIRFLSKISDLEAAAFNFTLDESRQIKNHYQKKLYELRSVYKGHITGNKNKDQKFIHSLTFTNMVLGDLEYFDQEYDNAVLFYMDALQELRYSIKDLHQGNIYNFIVYLRNSLKMGLAFEKQNNYDAALMTFETLKREILKLRNIKIEELGYREKQVPVSNLVAFVSDQVDRVGTDAIFASLFVEDGWKRGKIIEGQDCLALFEDRDEREHAEMTILNQLENLEKNSNTIINKDQLQKIKSISWIFLWRAGDASSLSVILDKHKNFFCISDGLFIRKYLQFNSDDKGKIHLNSTIFTFENLRLLYQPFIATLSILEKNGINSITNATLEQILKEFDFVSRFFNIRKAYMIEVEFLNKLGDILYFKNGMLKKSIKSSDNDVEKSKADIANKLGITPVEKAERDFNLPYQAMIFYDLSIGVFWNGTQIEEKIKSWPVSRSSNEEMVEDDIMPSTIEPNKRSEELRSALFNQIYDRGFYAEKYQKFKSDALKTDILIESFNANLRKGLYYLMNGVASPHYTNPRSNKLNTLANCYSDLGNAILSSIALEKTSVFTNQLVIIGNILELAKLLDEVLYRRYKEAVPEENLISLIENAMSKLGDLTVERVVGLYLVSSALYHKTYKNIKAAFQLQKVINLIDDILFIQQSHWDLSDPKNLDKILWEYPEPMMSGAEALFDEVEELFLIPFIARVNQAYQDSAWQDMANYKNITGLSARDRIPGVFKIQESVEQYLARDYAGILDEAERTFKESENRKRALDRIRRQIQQFNAGGENSTQWANLDFEFIKNSSIASEQKEVYIIMEKIRHRLKFKDNFNLTYKDFSMTLQSHPYVDNSNQMNRIHELSLRGSRLKRYYLFLLKEKKRIGPNLDQNEKIFVDAIYCYNALISKLNVMEASFQVPNIYFGFAHYELAWWLRELECSELQYDVLDALKKINEDRENDFLNKQYQWAKAKFHFLSAMQTHSGMEPYNHAISNMFYLDDDFNDDQAHFYAAQERFHINSGIVREYNDVISKWIGQADRLFAFDFFEESFVD